MHETSSGLPVAHFATHPASWPTENTKTNYLQTMLPTVDGQTPELGWMKPHES